jgi:hypothetical protein
MRDVSDSSSIDPYTFHAAYKPVELEPPEVPGGYLEPCSHFISRSSPARLFSELKTCFETQQCLATGKIDLTTVKPEKFKLVCVAYKPGECSLPFMARVFALDRDGSGKRYAVELQRRSGDVLHFWDVWSVCRSYFVSKGLTQAVKAPSVARPPPPQLDVEVTPEQIQSTVQCLREMALSDCIDVKSQAIQALSKLSIADSRIQRVMINEGCVDTLLKSIDCKLEDVHRCAVSALANLSHDNVSVCEFIARKNGIKLVCSLVTTSKTLQVHRECLRMLNSVLKSASASVDQEVLKAVKRLCHSSDRELSKNADCLFEALPRVISAH